MYPAEELIRLAGLKTALRRGISLHRAECVAAGARIARPVAWLDRVIALGRRLAPYTKLALVPVGLLLTRSALSRGGFVGKLVRWGPLAFAVTRGVRAAVDRQSATVNDRA